MVASLGLQAPVAVPQAGGAASAVIGDTQKTYSLPSTSASTTLAQDQAKAANQGKPGFDVLGNPIATPSPATPPKEYTTLSSDKTGDIDTNTQRMQTLQNTGLTLGADNLARYSDSSFATAPSDATPTDRGTWTSGGIEYAVGPATTQDPELKGFYDQLNQMKSSFDATSKSMIDNIHAQFDSLRQQQQDINQRQTASVGQSLLISGTARYAPETAAGETAAQASYGLRQIADLNVKEQTAVLDAQRAQQNGDMELMSKSLDIAEQARKEKQDAAKVLSDKLVAQADDLKKTQGAAAQDQAVAGQIASGITDPNEIMKALNGKTNPITGQPYALTAKDIATTIDNLNPNAKEIAGVIKEASTNGASKDILAKIGQSKSLAEAYQNASGYLQDPTSNAGMYNSYVQRTLAAGQTPISAEKFLEQNKAKEAGAVAYAQEAAKSAFVGSASNQQKLEQQYRSVLVKELSNRSGGLGLQDAKVNQAIQLMALADQYKDANGNYNIPTSQLHELAMGLASLISPSNTTAESDRQAINAATAKGDIAKMVQYATGVPQTGSTQAIIQNLIDSIDRQGKTSQALRDQSVQFLQGLAPTDLSSDRREALEKNTLASYDNPPTDPVAKATQEESLATSAIKAYDAQSPENAKRVDELHAQFPNATAVEIKQALGI